MKSIYIDCTKGICTDMFVSGFSALGATVDDFFDEQFNEIVHRYEQHKDCCAHHFHRSYKEVKAIISELPISESVRNISEKIYSIIAKAEAKVHESTIEEVHFHEVGRSAAILNIVKTAMLLDGIPADRIICSKIYDGCGNIECSHGIIPVPVPAVKAMMEESDYEFATLEVNTELVTPSGLATLMGIGAAFGDKPRGNIIAKGMGFGKKDTGLGGMEIYLIEE